MIKNIADSLRKLLGNDAVANDPATLAVHSGDKWFATHEPEVVVFARSTTEVPCFYRVPGRYLAASRGAGFDMSEDVPARGGLSCCSRG
jgi:hypothetical protein